MRKGSGSGPVFAHGGGRGKKHLFGGHSVLKSLNTAENAFLVARQCDSHLRQVPMEEGREALSLEAQTTVTFPCPGCLAPDSLLSCQLQHTFHGVQSSRAEVQDVALHANGLEPLRDTSVRDPIRATQAGQAEGHPMGSKVMFVHLEYRSWLAWAITLQQAPNVTLAYSSSRLCT